MIKAITYMKTGITTKMLMSLSKSLIQSVILFGSYHPTGLRLCHIVRRKNTKHPTRLDLGRSLWSKLHPVIQIIRNRPHLSFNKISANVSESNTPTVNIYANARSQANGTTASACFIKETDEEIRGRIPNHIPIIIVEPHPVKAALIWISTTCVFTRILHHLLCI